MIIRNAKLKDASSMVEIDEEYFQYRYRQLRPDAVFPYNDLNKENLIKIKEKTLEKIEKGELLGFVAEEAEKVVGYAWGGRAEKAPFFGKNELNAIYVRPEECSEGVGSALFSAFKQALNGEAFYLKTVERDDLVEFCAKMGGKKLEDISEETEDGDVLNFCAFEFE